MAIEDEPEANFKLYAIYLHSPPPSTYNLDVHLLIFFTVHQKLIWNVNPETEIIKGSALITVRPLARSFTQLKLNGRHFEIQGISVNLQPAVFEYRKDLCTAAQLLESKPPQADAPPATYYNRLGQLLKEDGLKREITIEIDPELLQEETSNVTLEDGSAQELSSFKEVLVEVHYVFQGSYEGLQLCRKVNKDGLIEYFEIIYADPSPMTRIWMPCIDSDRQHYPLWDFEVSVSTAHLPVAMLDRLHVIFSGVLFRQFSTETEKIFHFKLDSPMAASKIAFAIGLFDSVKIPLAPFAYAFCPVGMMPKLNIAVEFFSKAFGFFNWYLSTLFPFASYFLVFSRQTSIDTFSGANVAVMASHLLHDAMVIDQVYETRRLLAETLCQQYFGIKVQTANAEDRWLLVGMQCYLSSLLLRVFHGKNDYKYQLKVDLERAFELEAGMPPLHSTRLGQDLATREWLRLKSRIVFCMLERKLEKTGLQRVFMHLWSEICEGRLVDGIISTKQLLKSVKKMTGKDVKSFADQWIYGSGAPIFTCSFVYNRKKSSIDVELKQVAPGHPGKRYSGTLLIRVHEQEGVFDHSVHIDDFTHRFELPYHTKIRKMRKKKRTDSAPGTSNTQNTQNMDDTDHGSSEGEDPEEPETQRPEAEEAEGPVDENVAITSETSPISWIRLDPDMDWYCSTDMSQPDFMWMEQLEGDRDVAGQREAALKLARFPSEAAAESFEKAIGNWKNFYKIRMDAVMGLKSCSQAGLEKLLSVFGKKFGVERPDGQLPLPKPNLFDNLPNYFVQKAIPLAVSLVRDENKCIPDRALEFLLNLLQHNDNSYNSMSDNLYVAAIIDALGAALPARSLTFSGFQEAVEEMQRYARKERMSPYFRNSVACSVLQCLPTASQEDLASYLVPGHYFQVRLAALHGLLKASHQQGALPDALAMLGGLLRGDGENRKFFLGALREIEGLAKSIGPLDPEALWSLVGASTDLNFVETALKLFSTSFPPAVDDALEEKAEETIASTLPSAAAIAPIRLHIHELGSDADEEGPVQGAGDEADWMAELNEERGAKPIPKLRIQPLSGSARPSAVGTAGEATPLARVLQEIWEEYDSFPFRYPVDPSVPGYYAVIKHPMDLSSMQERIRCSRYGGLEDFVRDLRLMYDNCFTFNQPGSLIYDQALRLRQFSYKAIKRAFPDMAKMVKRHLTASEPIVIVPEELRLPSGGSEIPRLRLALPTHVATPPPSTSIVIPKLVISASPAKAVPPPPAPPVKTVQERLGRILEKVKGHQHAFWFAEPIDPIALGIPTYLDIVKEPMDFSTITAQLQGGKYNVDPELFNWDVQLVFGNAKLFNPSNSVVHQNTLAIERFYHRLWNKAFGTAHGPATTTTTTSTITTAAAPGSPSSPKRKRSSVEQSPVGGLKIKLNLVPEWERQCAQVLDQVSQREDAAPFLYPVDPDAQGCPTYFQEIPHPMDLSTIRSKLDARLYSTAKEFADDMRLIVKNCVKFNGKPAVITKMAIGMQTAFLALMHERGLHV